MIWIEFNSKQWKGLSLFSWVTIVLYVVGLVGMLTHPERFVPLSAWNLSCVSLLLLLDSPSLKKTIFFLIVAALGWCMEWVGVHTGMPFGIYEYGDGLGLKFLDIPWVIGANWAMLSWMAVEVVRWMWSNASRWKVAWMAAVLMVLMDFLLEPVAPYLDYWMFQLNWVPVQNFLAWGWLGLIFSFLMSFIPSSKGYFPVLLAFVQWVFFIVLNIVI
jgi:putative membrane protein